MKKRKKDPLGVAMTNSASGGKERPARPKPGWERIASPVMGVPGALDGLWHVNCPGLLANPGKQNVSLCVHVHVCERVCECNGFEVMGSLSVIPWYPWPPGDAGQSWIWTIDCTVIVVFFTGFAVNS